MSIGSHEEPTLCSVFKRSINTYFVYYKYGLGLNYCGVHGLGHNRPVDEITEIKELSDMKINNLFIGENHVLGRNEVTLIGWGKNEYGQLGRGYTSKDDGPLNIEKLKDEKN